MKTGHPAQAEEAALRRTLTHPGLGWLADAQAGVDPPDYSASC
jgi:hypothetical protein